MGTVVHPTTALSRKALRGEMYVTVVLGMLTVPLVQLPLAERIEVLGLIAPHGPLVPWVGSQNVPGPGSECPSRKEH